MERLPLSLGVAAVALATVLFLLVAPADPVAVGLYGGLMGLGGFLVGIGLSGSDPDSDADPDSGSDRDAPLDADDPE